MIKKILFTVFFLATSMYVLAQKKVLAKINLSNGDTITSPIIVRTNMVYHSLLDERSIFRGVRLIDSNSKRSFLPAKNIRKLSFVDFTNRERVFISGKNKELVELLFNGKIKWQRIFYVSNYSVEHRDMMTNQYGESVSIGLFNSVKNKLKEITHHQPQLISDIETLKMDGTLLTSDENILIILRKYEKL